MFNKFSKSFVSALVLAMSIVIPSIASAYPDEHGQPAPGNYEYDPADSGIVPMECPIGEVSENCPD